MKLQAVMENLHRQQRAKLLMELEQQQQLQQQAGQSQVRNTSQSNSGNAADEMMGSPAPEAEHAQIAALAAMRAVAAGLQRAPSSPMSEHSSVGEDEEDEDDEEGEEPYKDMMGSEEEERIKQKWDEEDFEGEMEEDYEDDLGDEGVPSGREAVGMGKGILLLPHRQLHPHSQLMKARPMADQEPRVSALPPHGSHSQLGGQDHGDWTYEEQFRQLYELDGDPKRKEFLDDLFSFMQKRGTPVNRIPIMAKQVLDLYMLYQLVTEKGGLVEVINKKLWREITKGLNLPTSITSAAFTLRTQYMKYLYPYECDKRGLSNPNELQAAIDSNRREGRRQGFGSTLFTYSPNGTPTMLSSPKLSMPSLGIAGGTNGAPLTPIQKVKKEDEGGQPMPGAGRLPVALAGHTVVAAQAAAVQAAAAQAAMAAQVAALEQLRDKLETGEPPEKKMALPAEEHQRLLQRALQHNLLAMTAQMPMNIRISNQDNRQDSALNLTANGMSSISMSVELNGVLYTGVLFAQAAGSAPSGPSGSSGSSNNKAPGGRSGSQPIPHTPTSSSSNNPSP
ncbi:AT-rich interactive domain-containing protein 3A [Megalops cyprinoides]|uniref:AT-rich interactive domain-containing protein 3A n=1 Tax=Megalops cyprinoides TaxID=118141 RepID=UPI001863FC6A|nr:AT-rich interactive domain-containing protein 3A [Megalops cyprinoides]XP_036377537.1 AT-rich interactive domain-containing protein 3A [Megalops cyprinoides]XP_036377538.1 AT-rich interactive domain-containing protein 3A [Megalops cyprinoides]